MMQESAGNWWEVFSFQTICLTLNIKKKIQKRFSQLALFAKFVDRNRIWLIDVQILSEHKKYAFINLPSRKIECNKLQVTFRHNNINIDQKVTVPLTDISLKTFKNVLL